MVLQDRPGTAEQRRPVRDELLTIGEDMPAAITSSASVPAVIETSAVRGMVRITWRRFHNIPASCEKAISVDIDVTAYAATAPIFGLLSKKWGNVDAAKGNVPLPSIRASA